MTYGLAVTGVDEALVEQRAGTNAATVGQLWQLRSASDAGRVCIRWIGGDC